MSKGALVLDELIIPIIDIVFVSEIVLVTAEIRGPLRAGSAKRYVVNGQDGKTLFGGTCDQSWPELNENQGIRMQMGFNVAGKAAHHDDPVPKPGWAPYVGKFDSSEPPTKWQEWDPRRGG